MVSVVIPLFNAVNFIEKAILSALQFDVVSELIIVDDGSSDGSFELVHKLSHDENRIIVLTHENRENRGAAISRNLGIQKSNFPLISFLDSDDIYYLNRFQESVDLLCDNTRIDACFGIVEVINADTSISKHMGLLKWDLKSDLLTYLLKGGYFHTNSVTIRKSFFDQVGFFDQCSWPHEDTELWIRMAAFGKLISITDTSPIASYLIHGNNLSNVSSFQSKLRLWINVYEKVFYSSIGFKNKYLILRQIIKMTIKYLVN